MYNNFYPPEVIIKEKIKYSKYRISFTKPSKTEQQSGSEMRAEFSHLSQAANHSSRFLTFIVSDE